MKKLISLILALSLLCAAGAAPAEGSGGGRGGNGRPGGMRGGNSGGNGGGTDKSGDAELQAMIAEIVPKYRLLTFEDAETGTSLQYYLYVPENYDESQSYPLLQFIPDSSVVGKGTAMRLLQSLTETYSIDTNRIYTTGQSMGGMTSFHLSVACPDFFAAYLFVGSQWDTSLLSAMEDENFFYIVSAGDPKASAGQAELLALFETDGAAYSRAEWGAQDDAETQNAAVKAMLAEGNNANFVTFTLGTTLAEGQTSGGGAGEHMTSFDYAYKLEAVRDWLFEQSR